MAGQKIQTPICGLPNHADTKFIIYETRTGPQHEVGMKLANCGKGVWPSDEHMFLWEFFLYGGNNILCREKMILIGLDNKAAGYLQHRLPPA